LKKKHISVNPKLMEFFMKHDFPGNVRELEHFIEMANILYRQNQINIEHLPEDYLKDIKMAPFIKDKASIEKEEKQRQEYCFFIL
jgi:DNA-binding NtrC family response regulator